MIIKKTVFFGPFIGEFGWELIYWQGWVRRLCLNEFKDYRKIACSFPGREPFYPYVDEFWPIPEDSFQEPISSRAYIADNWVGGLPRADNQKVRIAEVYPQLKKIFEKFKKRLPPHTVFFTPWETIKDPNDGRVYGTMISSNPKTNEDFKTILVPYEKQLLEFITPTQEGIDSLRKIIAPEQKLLAIFPRCRLARRPDKNWTKENYEVLIHQLQQRYPQYKVAIFGAPGGAYFMEGVPSGCLDLINLEPHQRMDIQLAALRQSVLAIGGESGGMIFALAAGCSALCWGHVSYAQNFKKENYMKTKNYFYPRSNITVKTILKLISWKLDNLNQPLLKIGAGKLVQAGYLIVPKVIRNSKSIAKLKRRIFG